MVNGAWYNKNKKMSFTETSILYLMIHNLIEMRNFTMSDQFTTLNCNKYKKTSIKNSQNTCTVKYLFCNSKRANYKIKLPIPEEAKGDRNIIKSL
jgi:hypothetical protein